MTSQLAYPLVSVIMPIRNEQRFIARSLGAVVTQNYPADKLEILIADGMSTDRTRDIIQEFQRIYPNVRLIENPGRIVSSGLNAALKEANGEVIIRVDGHTEIAPDYVSQCVAALYRTGADNVGGRMVAIGHNILTTAIATATSCWFGVGGSRFHYSAREEWVETVYMGAWRREVFDRIGFFDQELVRNQDDEFNYRLLDSGGRILLSPRIHSKYVPRDSWRSLWRQYFQYGYWKVRVMQKHPRQMRPRHFIPGAFVAALLGAILAAPFSPWGRAALALVGGSYLLANLTASFLAARRAGWRHLPLLPLAFATLHLSYGLGFLAGLVRFAGRWRERPRQPKGRTGRDH